MTEAAAARVSAARRPTAREQDAQTGWLCSHPLLAEVDGLHGYYRCQRCGLFAHLQMVALHTPNDFLRVARWMTKAAAGVDPGPPPEAPPFAPPRVLEAPAQAPHRTDTPTPTGGTGSDDGLSIERSCED